jgi:hypothetical protein
LGFRVKGSRLGASVEGQGVTVLGFGFWVLGLKVHDAKLRVRGFVFEILGLRARGSGCGYGVSASE